MEEALLLTCRLLSSMEIMSFFFSASWVSSLLLSSTILNTHHDWFFSSASILILCHSDTLNYVDRELIRLQCCIFKWLWWQHCKEKWIQLHRIYFLGGQMNELYWKIPHLNRNWVIHLRMIVTDIPIVIDKFRVVTVT